MIHAVVTGAAGRMGMAIIHVIDQTEGMELSGALEKEGHKKTGTLINGIIIQHSFSDIKRDMNVLIDFTTPEATLMHIAEAHKRGIAAVIGTTGLTDSNKLQIQPYGEDIPIIMAPNMSVGINVLLKTVGKLATALGDSYDIEIIEAHHRHKKDAPSGTALRLGEVIAKAKGVTLEDVALYERRGIIGERKPGIIGFQTIRGGDIVGDHTILFAGPGERIELTHRAHSRETFAQGAVRAAKWVVGQPPGLYDMGDVLGL